MAGPRIPPIAHDRVHQPSHLLADRVCAIDGPANCRLVDEKPGCAATLFRVQPACCAPVEIGGEQQIRQLALPVGGPAGVLAMFVVEVVQIHLAHLVSSTDDTFTTR